jgi:hypothetical protein
LHPVFALMMNGAQPQVRLPHAECILNFSQVYIPAPKLASEKNWDGDK